MTSTPKSHQVSSNPSSFMFSAQNIVLLIIDANEGRAQKLARLMTLAGYRAIVVVNAYQAFDRFLHERFQPSMVMIGQLDNNPPFVLTRLMQHLAQDVGQEPPMISISNLYMQDEHLLYANSEVSSRFHILSAPNMEILQQIWQALPKARISAARAGSSLTVDRLETLGLSTYVSEKNRSSNFHFLRCLRSARQMISQDQWENVMGDVGLAHFRQLENWPPDNEQRPIEPELISCLYRAVLFANISRPEEAGYQWGYILTMDISKKQRVLLLVQHALRLFGRDRVMKFLLDALVNEFHDIRGENLHSWKQQADGSYVLMLRSNMLVYGQMGGSRPSCYVWIGGLQACLDLVNQKGRWNVSEVECSCQAHTGHCVYLFTPRR